MDHFAGLDVSVKETSVCIVDDTGRIVKEVKEIRPRDLADRMSQKPQPKIFTLPIDAARVKAREILNGCPNAGYMTVVENWRQLPDGQIEFTMRHLPTAD